MLFPDTHTAAIIRPSEPHLPMLVIPSDQCTLDSFNLCMSSAILIDRFLLVPPRDQQKIFFPREIFDFGSEKQNPSQDFSFKQLTG